MSANKHQMSSDEIRQTYDEYMNAVQTVADIRLDLYKKQREIAELERAEKEGLVEAIKSYWILCEVEYLLPDPPSYDDKDEVAQRFAMNVYSTVRVFKEMLFDESGEYKDVDTEWDD